MPREEDRNENILGLARRRSHMAPVRLFGNEVVTLEYSAARGWFPLRGWVPWGHCAEGVEYGMIVEGSFRAKLATSDGVKRVLPLPTGSLLRIPRGIDHRFRAGESGLCVGLIISGRPTRTGDVANREDARGFNPFLQ